MCINAGVKHHSFLFYLFSFPPPPPCHPLPSFRPLSPPSHHFVPSLPPPIILSPPPPPIISSPFFPWSITPICPLSHIPDVVWIIPLSPYELYIYNIYIYIYIYNKVNHSVSDDMILILIKSSRCELGVRHWITEHLVVSSPLGSGLSLGRLSSLIIHVPMTGWPKLA